MRRRSEEVCGGLKCVSDVCVCVSVSVCVSLSLHTAAAKGESDTVLLEQGMRHAK